MSFGLALSPEQTDSVRTEQQSTAGSTPERPRNAVSLGDTTLNSSDALREPPSQKTVISEVPEKPLPGQRKPGADGRCPKRQLAINGGCWVKVDLDPENCYGNVFVYQGGCYMPINASGLPTSAPQEH